MHHQHRLTAPLIAAAMFTAVFLGCDSTPVDVTGPGILNAVLISPNGAEGAAVLQLIGPGLGQVTAAEGDVFAEHGSDGVRLVIVLDQPGDIKFRIAVDDVGDFPTWEVIEVADGANELRPSSSGYSMEFAR